MVRATEWAALRIYLVANPSFVENRAELVNLRADWSRAAWACPDQELGIKIIDTLASLLGTKQCTHAPEDAILKFTTVFKHLHDSNHRVLHSLTEDLLDYLRQHETSPLVVCGRTKTASHHVTSVLRSLQRVPYGPLPPDQPFSAIFDFPTLEMPGHLGDAKVVIPRVLGSNAISHPDYPPTSTKHQMCVCASATPPGWVFGPVSVEDGVTLIIGHVHGRRLWYDFPRTETNTRVMKEYTGSGPIPFARLEDVQWLTLEDRSSFFLNAGVTYGFLSITSSFHTKSWVLAPTTSDAGKE
jgi:hypothetical protein